MPKLVNIPVYFSLKTKENWERFWAAIPDEDPMDLRQSFERAAALPQDEMAAWDIELADGVSAYVHPQIPGFAFVAKIFQGYVQVITWTPTHGTKGESAFEWKPKKKAVAREEERPKEVRKTEVKPVVESLPVDVKFDPIPTDLDPEQFMRWANDERPRLAAMIEGVTGGPLRQAIMERIKEVKALAVAACSAENNDGERDRLTERPDGSAGGLVPVARYLLRVVKELQARVAKLEGK